MNLQINTVTDFNIIPVACDFQAQWQLESPLGDQGFAPGCRKVLGAGKRNSE
jgi:hypothetical protein